MPLDNLFISGQGGSLRQTHLSRRYLTFKSKQVALSGSTLLSLNYSGLFFDIAICNTNITFVNVIDDFITLIYVKEECLIIVIQ